MDDLTFPLQRSIAMLRANPTTAREAFAAAARDAAPCANCGKNHRTLTFEQCVDRKMSEKTLQDRIRGMAKRRGWVVAHAGRGWVGDLESGAGRMVTQMAPGFPDLFFLKPPTAFFAELKREEGVLDPEQDRWLHLLNACGIPAVVFRPSDLREGRVKAVLEGR